LQFSFVIAPENVFLGVRLAGLTMDILMELKLSKPSDGIYFHLPQFIGGL